MIIEVAFMVTVFAFAGNGSVKVLDLDKIQKEYKEKRDYELEQLSKHVREFKKKFNDPVSLKLLEVTLKTNAMLVREDYE